jgi:UDP-glucose 4-epimerase
LKTILIIGSTGFIGKELKKKLNNKYSLICPSKKKGFNISNLQKLKKFLNKNIDIIINLSGQISSNSNLSRTILRGNQNIIKLLQNKKKPIVYYISTSLVYGYSTRLLNEESVVNPVSNYAAIKLKAEREYNLSNLNYKILRLSNVYSHERTNIINSIINSANQSKELFVNNINSYRNYIYIKDLIEIIKKIIETNLKFKVYNIGHENISIKKIINLVEKKFKKKLVYVNKKNKLELDSSHKLQKCKIFKEINSYPRYSINKFLDERLKNEFKFY